MNESKSHSEAGGVTRMNTNGSQDMMRGMEMDEEARRQMDM